MSDGPHDRRCACGKPAMHTLGMKAFFCCRCWVAMGMPPAEWHPECVKAANDAS